MPVNMSRERLALEEVLDRANTLLSMYERDEDVQQMLMVGLSLIGRTIETMTDVMRERKEEVSSCPEIDTYLRAAERSICERLSGLVEGWK